MVLRKVSCLRNGGHKFAHATAPSPKGEIRTPAPRGLLRFGFALPRYRLVILPDDKCVLSYVATAIIKPTFAVVPYWVKKISSSKKIDVRLVLPDAQRRALG